MLLALICTCGAASAELEGMSLERDKVRGITRFSEVSVRCVGSDAVKTIRRTSKHGAPWCAAGDNGVCDKSKFLMATRVCEQAPSLAADELKGGTHTTSLLSANDGVNTELQHTRRSQLLQEQLLIEEQRIQLEERRIELVRQELQLRRTLAAVAGVGD